MVMFTWLFKLQPHTKIKVKQKVQLLNLLPRLMEKITYQLQVVILCNCSQPLSMLD